MTRAGGGDPVALVLAGAVAKGAFAVGAVDYLAQADVSIRRVAATSSGALTAAVLGAGIASGRLPYAAEVATELWLDHGAWTDFAHVSLADWVHASGLLDTLNVAALVREGIRRVVRDGPAAGPPAAVKVTLIATRLVPRACTPDTLPLYERALHFEARDFLDEARWGDVAAAAAASATFPGVFSPTLVGGEPLVDGGAVNNAPISYVLDDPAVKKVVVVTSESSDPAASVPSGGVDLVGRLADILINERVSQDIVSAKKTNAALRRVKEALEASGADAATTQRVLAALGWRELEFVLVHPDAALEGTAFSAFFDRRLRRAYIDEGRRAAERALARAPVP